MGELPLVSICMLTFNHEKYIEQAINGVLMQQCDFNFELVLSNDCSSDKTHQIIQKTLKGNSKSLVINYYNHKQNQGMMANFLFALKKCKGKYIALCDGDDFWTNKLKLQKQIDFLNSNPEYVACFHNAIVIEENDVKKDYHTWETERTVDISSIIIHGGGIYPTSSFIYRNTAELLSLDFEINAGDTLLIYSLLDKGLFYYMKEKMSVYKKHSQGVYSSIKKDKNKIYRDIRSNLNLLQQYKKTTPNFLNDFNSAIQKQLHRLSNNLGSKYIFLLYLDGALDFSNLKLFLIGKFKTKYIE